MNGVSQSLGLGVLLACALAAAAAARAQTLERIAPESGCRPAQESGLSVDAARQKALLVLYACQGRRRVLALVEGLYPVNSASQHYRIVAKLDRTLALGESLDLAAGICVKGRRTLAAAYAVRANWAGRQRVSHGHGLAEILVVAPNHAALRALPLAGVVCYSDEP